MDIRLTAAAIIIGLIVIQAPLLEGKKPIQADRGLMLLVCDLAGVRAETRLAAKHYLMDAFAAGGVEVLWNEVTDRLQPCTIPARKSFFTVVILPEPLDQGPSGPEAMGMAPARTGPYPRAYVFYSHVKRFLKSFAISDERQALGLILGLVIAHEVGHLLIGELHGPGIMTARWTFAEWESALKGNLRFHSDHIRQMRNRLQSIND